MNSPILMQGPFERGLCTLTLVTTLWAAGLVPREVRAATDVPRPRLTPTSESTPRSSLSPPSYRTRALALGPHRTRARAIASVSVAGSALALNIVGWTMAAHATMYPHESPNGDSGIIADRPFGSGPSPLVWLGGFTAVYTTPIILVMAPLSGRFLARFSVLFDEDASRHTLHEGRAQVSGVLLITAASFSLAALVPTMWRCGSSDGAACSVTLRSIGHGLSMISFAVGAGLLGFTKNARKSRGGLRLAAIHPIFVSGRGEGAMNLTTRWVW